MGKLLLILIFCFLASGVYANDTIQARKLFLEADKLFDVETDQADSLALLNCNKAISILLKQKAESTLLADCYFLTGLIHNIHSRYALALMNHHNALAIRKRKLDSHLLQTYQALGDTFFYLSKYDSAHHYYEIVDGLVAKVSGYKNQLHIVNALGSINYNLSNYKQAVNYFEKAIHLTKKPDQLTSIYLNLSDSYRKLKEYDDALKALKKARIYAGNKSTLQHIICYLNGLIDLNRSNHQAAIVSFLEAERRYKYLKANNREFEINLYNGLAESYYSLNKHETALIFFDKSISLIKNKTLPAVRSYIGRAKTYKNIGNLTASLSDYEQAIKYANTSDLYSFNALSGKASVLYQMDNFQGALATYQSAMRRADRIQRSYDSDEMKLFFTETAYPIYEQAIETAFKLYEKTHQEHYKKLIFSLMEKSKAGVLAEAIRVKKYVGVPDALLVQERLIKARIASINSQLVEAKNSQVAGLREQLREQEIELGKLAKVFEKYPEYYRLKYDTSTIRIDQVQGILKDGMAMISYFKGMNGWYAVVITTQNLEVARLKVDNNALEELRVALYDYEELDNYLGNEPGHRLYQQLFKPLLPYLTDIKRVVIAPDAELNYIPFDVLVSDLKGERYLLHDYAVSRTPSARLFVEAQQRPVASSPSLLAFAPFSNTSTPTFAMLRHSKWEIETINKQVPGKLLFDSKATKQAFLNLFRQHDIIQLSTHGVATGTEPCIEFYDGELYAHELYALNMDNVNFLVLSACEMGSGKLNTGEGIMSLARAFSYAGCASTITTMWKTNDFTSSLITTKLFKLLREGYTKDEALRISKLAYIDSMNSSLMYPAYWSNFVVSGNIEPIYKTDTSNEYYYIIGSVAILIVIIVVLKLRKSKVLPPFM